MLYMAPALHRIQQEQEPGGPDKCACPDCDYEADKGRGTPCRSMACPECGAKLIAAEEKTMEFGDSWKIEVGGQEVAVNDLVEAWQILNEAATKTIDGKSRPAGDFLVVSDKEKASTWHLPVRVNGKVNRRLMGGAKAALTVGYRGKKYTGPNKAEAIRKLKALYKSEDVEWAESAVEELDVDGYQSYPRTGVMTFADLQLQEEAHVKSRRIRSLTSEFNMMVDNIMYDAEVDKSAALRSLFDEFIGLVDAELGEIAEQDSGKQTFSESVSGAVIQLAEAELTESDGPRSPLEMNVVLIQPGFGNKKDNHFYPTDVLARDAGIFEGVKMYATDHRPGEKSVRTEVSKIKGIAGFTQGQEGITDGSPIANVVVFDPAFAEMVRNRAAVGELSSLECSILASGVARKGKVNGRKAKVVESITAASSVDWVSRAGAGGRALNLAEVESEVDMETKKEHEEEVAEQGTEQVILSEDAEPVGESVTPEPAREPEDDVTEGTPPADEPETLAEAEVRKLIGDRLPPSAADWLAEAQYTTSEQVMEAVTKAQQRVKALTGSGAVFGQSTQAQETETMTVETYQARLDEADRRHGLM